MHFDLDMLIGILEQMTLQFYIVAMAWERGSFSSFLKVFVTLLTKTRFYISNGG